MKALGMAGEYGAVWAATGVVGASIDRAPRAASGWSPAPSARSRSGVNFVVKVAVGRQRPLIEEHPPLAQGADQALLPLRARDLLGRRRDRARPGRAAGAPVPVRARGGDLRRAPLPRHALPVRRARRRRARLLPRLLVPGLGAPPTEERLFELAVDANERAQASRRAPGNGGAASPVGSGVGDSGPEPA